MSHIRRAGETPLVALSISSCHNFAWCCALDSISPPWLSAALIFARYVQRSLIMKASPRWAATSEGRSVVGGKAGLYWEEGGVAGGRKTAGEKSYGSGRRHPLRTGWDQLHTRKAQMPLRCCPTARQHRAGYTRHLPRPPHQGPHL